MVCSRVRLEEKRLQVALRDRGAHVERIDVRGLIMDADNTKERAFHAVLMRCIGHSSATYVARLLEQHGVRVINTSAAIHTCGDKAITSTTLQRAGLPIPETALAFSAAGVQAAADRLSYPLVLKPCIGSWGRYVARIADPESLASQIEIRAAIAAEPFYLQAYLPQDGYDVRAMVVGNETICAIRRCASSWIFNTARGAIARTLDIPPELDALARAVAQAVSGEIVAVDFLQDASGAFLVNEVNHTPEFHGATTATAVDIAGRMADYTLSVAEEAR